MENTIQEARGVEEGIPVRASINERKFFESMKHLFASSYSVLGELMQNARRAGATRIDFTVDVENKTATVQDDGHGITDFGVLVALCDSGWSEQVQLTDKPFGMGLFSLFFAAQTVKFRSGGHSLTVSLDDIVSKRELVTQIDPETTGAPGTRIDLIGLSDKMTDKFWGHGCGVNFIQTPVLFREINTRAKGFPIPVFINGQECERPYAKSSLIGMETSIGFVSFPGVTDDSQQIPETNRYQLFLQGLPIGPDYCPNQGITIHLDSVQFTARMPDRSELFDHIEQQTKIGQVLKGLVQLRLAQLKAAMGPKEFANKHWGNCKQHHCLHLMNDVPWIPAERFRAVERVDKRSDDVYGLWTCKQDEMVSREQFMTGQLRAWRAEPCSTDDSLFAALQLKVMQRLDVLSLMDNVDNEHWFNKVAPRADDLKFDWEILGEEGGSSSIWGDIGWCEIRLAKEVKMTITSEVDPCFRLDVSFTDDWVMLPQAPSLEDDEYSGEWRLNCYVIGADKSPDEPVDALSAFEDEHEHHREEWRDTAKAEFWGAVLALRGTPLSDLVDSVLNKHMTELNEKQMSHMCVVRAVQHRNHEGVLKTPHPDVIDLTDDAFWDKVASAIVPSGTQEEVKAQAEAIRQAFTAVVQPGWQEPATTNDQ